MNQQLKQRLVGSSVLVVLAVIFLPILLKRPEPIQPKPEVRNIEIQQPQSKQENVEIPEEVIQRYEALNGVDHNQSSISRSEEVDESPSNVTKEPSSSSINQKKESPTNINKPSNKNEENKTINDVVKTGWAIQLGSFSKKENAERLVNRLNDRQFSAYLEALESGDQAIYRVRVGPMSSKDKAQQVREKVEQQENLKAFIVNLDKG